MSHRQGSRRLGWLGLIILITVLATTGCQALSQHHAGDTERVGHLHCQKPQPAPPSVVSLASVQISGLVKSPGSVPIPPTGLRLVDAITQAGGVYTSAPFADSENLVLISLARGDELYHFSLTLLKQDRFIQDLKVRSGDGITVQEWLGTDLVKGRTLFRRNVEAPRGRFVDWLFDQAREAELAGFFVDLAERKNAFDDAVKKSKWTEAGNVLRHFVAPAAASNRGDDFVLAAKATLNSADELEAYARQFANAFITKPIRTGHLIQSQNYDLAFLQKYYSDLKQDISKPFDVPFILLGGGVYPLIGTVKKAGLVSDTNVSYPSLLDVKKSFNTGDSENAIIVLERKIGDRANTFAFRAERGTEFNPLESILMFPGDRVTVSQTPTLPIVLLDQLRPILDRSKKK